MGSFQIGLENLNNTNKNNYVAYYNIFDRKYDEKVQLILMKVVL